jgi:hypothetical protein
MHWYYAHDGQQDGPHSEEALQNLVKSGQINASTLVWREGMPNWLPVSEAAPHLLVGFPGAVPLPLAAGVRCVECGGVFPASETVSVGGANVCARCKPLHLQKMQEGVATMGPRENLERLVRIAKGQRGVNMAILLTFAGYACLMMRGVVAPARRPGAGASTVAVFALVGGVTVLVAVVLQALYVYRSRGRWTILL